MPATKITILGLGKQVNAAAASRLSTLIDERITVDGDDVVFPNYRGPKGYGAYHRHSPVPLHTSKLLRYPQGKAISSTIWNEPPDHRCGLTADIVHASLRAVSAPNEDLSQVLENEVIPLMRGLGCEACIPITGDPTKALRHIRLLKFFFLTMRDGPDAIRAAKRRQERQPSAGDDHDALDLILPNVIHGLDWVATLSRFVPVIPSYPIHRLQEDQIVAWHFIPERAEVWSETSGRSMAGALNAQIGPMGSFFHLPFPKKLGNKDVLQPTAPTGD